MTLLKQDQQLYMQFGGCLLFLSTRSRPDLSFRINYLTFFMSKASYHYLYIACKILREILKLSNCNSMTKTVLISMEWSTHLMDRLIQIKNHIMVFMCIQIQLHVRVLRYRKRKRY